MSGQKGIFYLAQLPGWEKPQGADFTPPESSAILSPARYTGGPCNFLKKKGTWARKGS